MNGHEFMPGTCRIRGRTTPWNTCACWNIGSLRLTGFPMVGDGLDDASSGGVEVCCLKLKNKKLSYLLYSSHRKFLQSRYCS